MIGSKSRMPKRARYPLFLAGLVIIIVGGLLADAESAPRNEFAAIVLLGFAFLISSVIFK